MSEFEIKLAVPAAARPHLLEALSGAQVETVPLHAIYFDTPGSALSARHVSLRVRREGDHWVQTLKAPGDSTLDRFEDNVPLGAAGSRKAPPRADLGRHTDARALEVIRSALGGNPGDALLQPVFEVKVDRRVRRVESSGSVVELAFDEGELLAQGRKAPVCELELELLEGDRQGLLMLARRWRMEWDLFLSTSSKAQRGQRLAAGEQFGEPVNASPPVLDRNKPTRGRFLGAVLDACLRQVLANAGEIAAGSRADEHIHQLRVGLRRLRTALRELPALRDAGEAVEPALLGVFRPLGEWRDRSDVVRAIEPRIEAAGGRPVRFPAGFHQDRDPREMVHGPAFQDALLQLLSFAETVRGDDRKGVRRMVAGRLDRLHQRVCEDGARFTRLSEERQHGVRKRLKRLRYLGEFVAPLYPDKAVGRYMKALKPAQDALGEYNDEIMAASLYRELAGDQEEARFAVALLEARRRSEAKACRKALERLADARPFWRKA